MNDIFISYSRKDLDCVVRVYQALLDHDFKVWLDRREIKLAEDWVKKITNSIQEARVFLLFWSENSAQSNYVTEEREIAERLAFGEKERSFLVINLDTTEMPETLKRFQFADMTNGCKDETIRQLITEIYERFPHLRYFSRKKSLQDQPHQEVPNTPFVSVLYHHTPHCKAYIVGPPDQALPETLDELVICLQFYQEKTKNSIEDIHRTLQDPDTRILHITGPDHPEETGKYGLSNDDPDQWESCRKFIIETINSVSTRNQTILKFFAIAPCVLLAGVTVSCGRFRHIQLYNWAGPKYKLVIESPLDKT